MSDIDQRNRNGRRCGREVPANFLVADRRQYVTHGLRQLREGDHVFVISQVQIKSNAFCDVFSEPPAGVTSLVSGPRDRCVKPVTVELKELPRRRPEIWKLFLK